MSSFSPLTTSDPVHTAGVPLGSPDHWKDRLAEAACYAVLQRIAPVLRHDVAGFMQPVGMLMMVLQRRVQMPEPDLQVIAKNVASVSALTKEATAGCMNAIGWMASREDTAISLRNSINEAATLLAMELSAHGLEIINAISDDVETVPTRFFRSVLVGALLAFCDQRSAGSRLQISLDTDAENFASDNRLMLRMMPGDASGAVDSTDSPSIDRPLRRIDWTDVEAMAASFGVAVARGEGWLAVGLPKGS